MAISEEFPRLCEVHLLEYEFGDYGGTCRALGCRFDPHDAELRLCEFHMPPWDPPQEFEDGTPVRFKPRGDLLEKMIAKVADGSVPYAWARDYLTSQAERPLIRLPDEAR
jgi:hypothetical protein